jgi:histidinol-phosphate aminotransferase
VKNDAKQDIEKYIRPHLLGFSAYSAATSPETLEGRIEVPAVSIIKLDANENPYGCSPKVLKALAGFRDWNIYPDDGQQKLRSLLSKYLGVAADRIVASGGSNQLIDLIIRLFVEPGDEVINFIPTFDIYRFSTEINGGKLVNIERNKDYSIDINKVKAAISANTKLIFIANPNNPTGNLMPQDEIIEIAETGIPLVIDEAYCEFSKESVIPLLVKYPNLMVLRTLSKWAGLAGLRIGCGIFAPEIARRIMAIKMPYNVNVAAIIALSESMADLKYLMDTVEAMIRERGRLFAELEQISWLKPYPSRANFIYCMVLKGSASQLHQKLQKKGILIRYFDKPMLNNGIRISVGKPEHTDILIKTLREMEVPDNV